MLGLAVAIWNFLQPTGCREASRSRGLLSLAIVGAVAPDAAVFQCRLPFPARELHLREIDRRGIDKGGPVACLVILPFRIGVLAAEHAPPPRQFRHSRPAGAIFLQPLA